MKRLFVVLAFISVLVFASCSSIPQNYHPPEYRKIAVFASFVPPVEYDIDSKDDLVEAIADGLIDDVADVLSGDYPEWRTTSELARLCSRCGYDVYLVAPEDYFEDRQGPVEVAHQKRVGGWIEDNYWDYIRQMKSQIGEYMEPEAYILCKQVGSESDDEDFYVVMHRWNGDKQIFTMSYDYFMRNYNDFFCGADVEEAVAPVESEPKVTDTKKSPDSEPDDSEGKGERVH